MDIFNILKKYNIQVPDEVVEDLNKDLRTNYKSVVEYKKIKEDLDAANAKIQSNTDFEGQFNTLKNKYDADIKAKQKELDDYKFDAKVQGALNGIEFSSDRVKNSVLGEIRNKGFKINETDGKIEGLDDYLKNLYKNEPGSFKAVDAGIHTWAGGSEDANKNKPSTDDVFNRVY